MDEKSWFGLMVRGFGLAAAFGVLHYGATALNMVLERREGISPIGSYAKEYIVLTTLFAAMSVYLLRGAPGLEKFCFPRPYVEFDEDETEV